MKISEINSAIQSATNLLAQLGCKTKVINAQGLVFKPSLSTEMPPKKINRVRRFSHADRNLDVLLKELKPGTSITLPAKGTTVVSLQSALLNAAKKVLPGPKNWYSTKDIKGKTATIHMRAK